MKDENNDNEKKYLENLYISQRKSTREIAKILGMSQPSVRKKLIKYNIPRRTYKENITPITKGSKLSETHKKKISEALKGNTIYLDPKTGKHRNDQRKEVNCEECGKIILRERWRLKNHERQFCDRECHGKWKSKNLLGTNHPRFSSIEINCLECGSLILAAKNRIEKFGEKIFCGTECFAQWRSQHQVGKSRYNWKGGYDDYKGESWYYARRCVLKRDNFTCQHCFKTRDQLGKNPDVHHKIPFRNFGVERHLEANNLTNLICYCNRCHKIMEETYLRFGCYEPEYMI